MKPDSSFEKSKPLAIWLLAASVGLASTSAAQYPQDPSRLTVSPPSATAVTPSLANDPAGERAAGNRSDGAKLSAGTGASTAALHDALSVKPIIPSKAELADAAFKKLDAGGKGYVSLEDVKDLNGFDKSFQLADADKDGRLDAAEFNKAWADYTGRKSG